jgi:rare lipoprotein A
MRFLFFIVLFAPLAVQGCALRPAARASAEKPQAKSERPRAKSEKPKRRSTGAPPAAGQLIEGKASYYSDRLAGRSTASGEPYDPKKLTAAHLTLRLGTRIKVTRVDTGASVVVKVNDRGPYGDRGRVVDLSRRAAEKLDMVRAGVVTVRVEILDP